MDKAVSKAAIEDGKLIEEEEVECILEKLSSSALDENVDVCLVCHYFTCDAWKVVEDVMKIKQAKNVRMCQSVNMIYIARTCDCCLKLFHFLCTGLTKQPKKKY